MEKKRVMGYRVMYNDYDVRDGSERDVFMDLWLKDIETIFLNTFNGTLSYKKYGEKLTYLKCESLKAIYNDNSLESLQVIDLKKVGESYD